jgi:hypothetical protein
MNFILEVSNTSPISNMSDFTIYHYNAYTFNINIKFIL